MASIYYRGAYFTITACDDFETSLTHVIAIHHKNNDKDLAKGDRLIKILADTGRLRSPDQFRQETSGFWAIKAGKIRFYGWYEADRVFVLSHTIFKAADKLAQVDIDRMNTNQSNYRKKGKK
jgi:hypothetical protein